MWTFAQIDKIKLFYCREKQLNKLFKNAKIYRNIFSNFALIYQAHFRLWLGLILQNVARFIAQFNFKFISIKKISKWSYRLFIVAEKNRYSASAFVVNTDARTAPKSILWRALNMPFLVKIIFLIFDLLSIKIFSELFAVWKS